MYAFKSNCRVYFKVLKEQILKSKESRKNNSYNAFVSVFSAAITQSEMGRLKKYKDSIFFFLAQHMKFRLLHFS